MTRRRANIQQGVCCYAGRRIYFQLLIAISPYPADGILLAFVVIFIISFLINSSSELDIIKYQHSSKLWPLYAISLTLQNQTNMGVTIHFEGQLKSSSDYQAVIEKAETFAKSNGMNFQLFDSLEISPNLTTSFRSNLTT